MKATRLTCAGAAVAAAFLVAGCGYHPADRALSGGLLGAGAGAGVAAATGGSVGGGALLGGAAGAVTGAVTRPDQINLGRPLWRP